MRSIGVQISLNLRCRALDALWFLPKESEDPVMDEAAINQLLKNAIDQANAEAEQKLEERLKALKEDLTKKYQEERIEVQDAFAQSRGDKP